MEVRLPGLQLLVLQWPLGRDRVATQVPVQRQGHKQFLFQDSGSQHLLLVHLQSTQRSVFFRKSIMIDYLFCWK